MSLNINGMTPGHGTGGINNPRSISGNPSEGNLRSFASQFKSGIEDCKKSNGVFGVPAGISSKISHTSPELAEQLILNGVRELAALDPRTSILHSGAV